MKFEAPRLEIIRFQAEDVITTSIPVTKGMESNELKLMFK